MAENQQVQPPHWPLEEDDDPTTLIFKQHADVTPAALISGIKTLDFTYQDFEFKKYLPIQHVLDL